MLAEGGGRCAKVQSECRGRRSPSESPDSGWVPGHGVDSSVWKKPRCSSWGFGMRKCALIERAGRGCRRRAGGRLPCRAILVREPAASSRASMASWAARRPCCLSVEGGVARDHAGSSQQGRTAHATARPSATASARKLAIRRSGTGPGAPHTVPRLPSRVSRRPARGVLDHLLGRDVERGLEQRHLDELPLARCGAGARGPAAGRRRRACRRSGRRRRARRAAGRDSPSSRPARSPARSSSRSPCGRATGRRARRPACAP